MQNPGKHNNNSVDPDTSRMSPRKKKKMAAACGLTGTPDCRPNSAGSRKRPLSEVESVADKLNPDGDDGHPEVPTDTRELCGPVRVHKKSRLQGRGELGGSPQTDQTESGLPGTPVPNTALTTPLKGAAGREREGIPRGGKVRIAWTLSLKRALLSIGRKCSPLKRKHFGDRLLERWLATFPERPTTKGALMQAHLKCRRQVEVARSETRASPVRKRRKLRSYFNTPTPPGRHDKSRSRASPDNPMTPKDSKARKRLQFGAGANGDDGRKSGPLSELATTVGQEIKVCYLRNIREKEGNFSERMESVGKVSIPIALIRAADDATADIWESEGKNQSLWRLNCLIYAAGVVLNKLARSGNKRTKSTWEQKSDGAAEKCRLRLAEARRWYSRVAVEMSRQKKGKILTRRTGKNRTILQAKYGSTAMSKLTIESVKLRDVIKIYSEKVKRMRNRARCRLVNARYRSQGMKALGSPKNRHSKTPAPNVSRDAMEDFWRDVVGQTGTYQPEHKSIVRWRSMLGEIPSFKGDLKISVNEWQRVVRKVKSWRAPGPDLVRPYWFKILPELSSAMRCMCQDFLNCKSPVPQWMIRGRTVLIPKDGCDGSPGKYRPIACLNSSYKLLTAVVMNKLLEHVVANGVLPVEQRALRRGHRGCLDALLIDRSVAESRRMSCRDLSVAWIDFQKAYDRVPHKWMLDALKAVGAPDRIVQLMRGLSKSWSTVFEVKSGSETVRTGRIQYRRGVYQGDALSPLLFCLCVAPVSETLRRFPGVEWVNGERLTHLFYMDDLKVYAEGERELADMVGAVERASRAVGMAFGMKKCAVASMRGGKPVGGKPLRLDETQVMEALSTSDSYRYLGLEQLFDPKMLVVRRAVAGAVGARVRTVVASKLGGRNKTLATNAWALSMLRYYLPVIKWSQRELMALDRGVRRRLILSRDHNINTAVERYSLARRDGGRGFLSCQQMYVEERISAATYLVMANDPLLEKVVIHQREWEGKQCSLLQEAEGLIQKADPDLLLTREDLMERSLTARKVVRIASEFHRSELLAKWRAKRLHGPFRNTIESEGIDSVRSFLWLTKGKVSARTEALVVAAQDGVLWTLSYKQRILKRPIDPMCRCCGEARETVGHILSCCSSKNWSLYKERHDRILAVLTRHVCAQVGLPGPTTTGDPRKWVPETGLAIEGESSRVTVDVNVPTERTVTACRPDLVLYWRDKKVIIVFEVACAWDPLVLEREQEKWHKYEPLARDIATRYRESAVIVIPIVIGTLGVVGSLHNRLTRLGLFPASMLDTVIGDLQLEAIRASAQIIRGHLAIKGSASGKRQ